MIRDDRQIAPLGRFDPPPEIVSVGIPDTLPVGLRVATLPGHFRDVPEESRYRFAPEFRGLGDPARLRVGIYELGRYDTWNEVTPDGRSRPRIDVTVPTPFPPPLDFSVGARERTPEEDGRFMLKLPLKPGPRRLVMVVANDDNVVVTKEFQVTFAPRWTVKPGHWVPRGRIGSRVLGGGVTYFPEELPGEQLLVLWPDDPLPYGGAVRRWTMPIQFDYSVDGGRRWHMLRYAGPTAWYVVPSAWPSVKKPYDLGFEKVARYAAGRSDTQAIAGALTSGGDGEIEYDPDDDVICSHPLEAYQRPPRPAQCWNHAKLLEYLVSVVG